MINAKGTILFPVMSNADKVQAAFASNLQAAIQGQKTVKAALSDAANSWNSLIKE
jgi:maltose-binding protein MalE